MVVCDICGEPIDDEGYLVEWRDERRDLLCPKHFGTRDTSEEHDVLFHWGPDDEEESEGRMKIIVTIEHPDPKYCIEMARRLSAQLDHIPGLKYCIHIEEAEG